MTGTTGQAGNLAARLGLQRGSVVGEIGYDDDVDPELREAVESVTGAELLDEDADEVLDAVLLWWRDDDGDLTDALVDAITLLADDGLIWLMTPTDRPRRLRGTQRDRRGDPDRWAGADHHVAGWSEMDAHQARALSGSRAEALMTEPRRRPRRLPSDSPRPDFTLPDVNRNPVSLTDFRGQQAVLLVFYPFAFSGICTGELSQVRDHLEDFQNDTVQILAISTDPTYALRAWAAAEGFAFPLLSDFWPHGEVAEPIRSVQRRGRDAVARHIPRGSRRRGHVRGGERAGAAARPGPVAQGHRGAPRILNRPTGRPR